MMLEEFENLSGIFPSWNLWLEIEKLYSDFDGDKVAFVKAYKKNKDFIASRAQTNANKKSWAEESALEKERRDREAAIDRVINDKYRCVEMKIKELKKVNEELEEVKKERDALKNELAELKNALSAFKGLLNKVA